jgi:hypothetical protein
MALVVDACGKDTLYLHKDLWEEGDETIERGRFWGWAKRVQEKYFQAQHS